PLALAGLALEHLLILDLDLGLVGHVALDLEGSDVVARRVGDRDGREDEAELVRLAIAHDRAADLVEPDVPAALPALHRDAVVTTDVELDDLVAVLALEATGHLARQHGEEGPVEIHDATLAVDDEVAVDDRR